MIDLIYAEGYETEMKQDILGMWPEAVFEDASDFIHRGRFQVEVDCTEDNWREQMFLTGLFDFSIHMQFWRIEQPTEYIETMRRAVETKKAKELNNDYR